MAFTLRLYQRFPVQCSVTYHDGPFQGQGTVWNLSMNGWKLSGDVPLRVGRTCSLTVNLPNQLALRLHVPDEASPIHIEQAAVRWSRERELGVGFITVAPPHQERLDQLLARLKQGQQA